MVEINFKVFGLGNLKKTTKRSDQENLWRRKLQKNSSCKGHNFNVFLTLFFLQCFHIIRHLHHYCRDLLVISLSLNRFLIHYILCHCSLAFIQILHFLKKMRKNLYVPVLSNDVWYNISKRESLKAWIKATPIISLLVINFMFYFSHETELYNMIYYCIYRVTKLHSNWKGEAYWVNIA